MSPHADVPAPLPPAERYRHLAERFTEVVLATPSAMWTCPSPCEQWTALDVFAHVVSTEADFLARMPGAEPLDLGLADHSDRDHLMQAWVIVRDAVQRSLDDPARAGQEYDGYFGRTTFQDTIEKFYASDLVVHAWDIAAATGRAGEHRIDPSEMARYRADFAGMADMMRQPGVLGPELEVESDADDQTRFLAWLGRREP